MRRGSPSSRSPKASPKPCPAGHPPAEGRAEQSPWAHPGRAGATCPTFWAEGFQAPPRKQRPRLVCHWPLRCHPHPLPTRLPGWDGRDRKAGRSPRLTADVLPPAPQHDALGGAGAGIRGQGRTHAVLRAPAVARVILAPLGGRWAVRWEPARERHAHASTDMQHVHVCTSIRTHSPYTHTQHSRAARTFMHKRSDTQHIHLCTALTHSMYTRAQALRHAARTLMHKHLDMQPVHACTALTARTLVHKRSDMQHVHLCTALTHSTYTGAHALGHAACTHAQALGHAARTRVHSSHTQHVHSCTSAQTRSPYPRAQHSDMQPVHTCTALRHSAYTHAHTHPSSHVHTHTSSDIHVLVHTQQFPTGGVGLSQGWGPLRAPPTL